MYEVEHGVPIPEGAGGPRRVYPFAEMQIGDSFFVRHDDRTPHQVESAAGYHARRFAKKFRVRRTADGVRVWRIA